MQLLEIISNQHLKSFPKYWLYSVTERIAGALRPAHTPHTITDGGVVEPTAAVISPSQWQQHQDQESQRPGCGSARRSPSTPRPLSLAACRGLMGSSTLKDPRSEMEDDVVLRSNGLAGFSFVTAFDGHSGFSSVEFLSFVWAILIAEEMVVGWEEVELILSLGTSKLLKISAYK